MICNTCRGNTVLPIKRDGKVIGVRMCPDCIGGTSYCCDDAGAGIRNACGGERPGNVRPREEMPT